MANGLQQTVAPTVEPVTLEEMKLHSRIEHADDDTLISALITAARQYAERVLDRQLITATWAWTLDGFYGTNCRGSTIADHAIRLPYPPVQSVTSIKYYDTATPAVQQTIAASSYHVDIRTEPARIVPAFGFFWPVPQYQRPGAVEIVFVAGYGASGSSVPEGIRLAIKLMVAHWYEHREAVDSMNYSEVPMAVKALLYAHSYGEYV